MRAIVIVCVLILWSCRALAAEKPADPHKNKPVEAVAPKTVPAHKPCHDVYAQAQESAARRSDSIDQAAREAMVRSSSPLGKALHQLSCVLART
jgi:hypothetical protein